MTTEIPVGYRIRTYDLPSGGCWLHSTATSQHRGRTVLAVLVLIPESPLVLTIPYRVEDIQGLHHTSCTRFHAQWNIVIPVYHILSACLPGLIKFFTELQIPFKLEYDSIFHLLLEWEICSLLMDPKVEAVSRNRTDHLPLVGQMLYIWTNVNMDLRCELLNWTSSVAQTAIPTVNSN